jgi:hypothetical protein
VRPPGERTPTGDRRLPRTSASSSRGRRTGARTPPIRLQAARTGGRVHTLGTGAPAASGSSGFRRHLAAARNADGAGEERHGGDESR